MANFTYEVAEGVAVVAYDLEGERRDGHPRTTHGTNGCGARQVEHQPEPCRPTTTPLGNAAIPKEWSKRSPVEPLSPTTTVDESPQMSWAFAVALGS